MKDVELNLEHTQQVDKYNLCCA